MAGWWSNEIFPNANRSSGLGAVGWGIVDAALLLPRAVSITAAAPFSSSSNAAATLSKTPGGNPSPVVGNPANVVNPANSNGVHQKVVNPTFNRVSDVLGGPGR
jgi:hypothetical protein